MPGKHGRYIFGAMITACIFCSAGNIKQSTAADTKSASANKKKSRKRKSTISKCWKYDPAEFRIWKNKKISRKRTRKNFIKAKSIHLCLPKGEFMEDEPIEMIIDTNDSTYVQNKIVCSALKNDFRKCMVLDDTGRMKLTKEMNIRDLKLDFTTIDHYEMRSAVLGIKDAPKHRTHSAKKSKPVIKKGKHYICFKKIDKKSGRYTGCISSASSCYSRELLLYGYYASSRRVPSALKECRTYVEE